MLRLTPQADVDRPPRLGGPGRQLERPFVPSMATEAENKLLHPEVACICRCVEQIPPECDHDRLVEGGADPLEDFKVRVRDSSLDATFDHPSDAGPIRQSDARPAAPFAHRSDLGAETDALLRGPMGRFDRQWGAPDAGHDLHMFIARASLPLIGAVASSSVDQSGSELTDEHVVSVAPHWKRRGYR